MYITKVAIKNFRNIEDLTVKLDRFNIIIGGNDVGKTNFCEALSKIFEFRGQKYLFDYSDFKNHLEPITIDIWFSDLKAEDKFFYDDQEINLRGNTIHWHLEIEWDYERGEIGYILPQIIQDDIGEEEGKKRFVRFEQRESFLFDLIPAYRSLDKEFARWGDIPYIFKRDVPLYSKSIKEISNSIPRILEEYSELLDNSDEGKKINELVKKYNETLRQLQEASIDYENFLEEINAIKKQINNSYNKITPVGLKEELKGFIDTLFKNINVIDERIRITSYSNKIKEIIEKNEDIKSLRTEIGEFTKKILDKDIDIDLFPDTEEILTGTPNIKLERERLYSYGDGTQSSFILSLKLYKIISRITRGFREKPSISSLICIEEPEVHLHPQRQRLFIKQIKELQKVLKEKNSHIQFIITTHSSNILGQINFDEIRIFRRDSSGLKCYFPRPSFLDDCVSDISDEHKKIKHKRGIKKFLSNLMFENSEAFFARSIIIAEGESELGALPLFASKVPDNNGQGISFDFYAISLIISRGVGNIEYLKKLLEQLEFPVTVIRDRDKGAIEEERIFCTEKRDFEEEIISNVSLQKILGVLETLHSETEITDMLKDLKGKIKSITINEFSDCIKNIGKLVPEEKENLKKLVKIRLKNKKGVELGRLLGEIIGPEEIPDCYRKVIRRAYESSL
jgi:predicted ATP-dependent endonuclease of OLD family